MGRGQGPHGHRTGPSEDQSPSEQEPGKWGLRVELPSESHCGPELRNFHPFIPEKEPGVHQTSCPFIIIALCGCLALEDTVAASEAG